MIFRFIIVGILPALITGLNLIKCKDGSLLPNNVHVNTCTTTPCDLVINSTIVVTIDFNTPNGGKDFKTKVFAESSGLTGEYNLPIEQSNVCGRLIRGSCPLDPDEDARYVLEMLVSPEYPITTMVLEISIVDRYSKTMFCFRIPAQTVWS